MLAGRLDGIAGRLNNVAGRLDSIAGAQTLDLTVDYECEETDEALDTQPSKSAHRGPVHGVRRCDVCDAGRSSLHETSKSYHNRPIGTTSM
jgi:hypothetical protein